MEISIKLPKETVQKDTTDIFEDLDTQTQGFKQWITVTVYYLDKDIEQLSCQLDTLFKEVFKLHEHIGMRINGMPYIATIDNKNVKEIMQKLLK